MGGNIAVHVIMKKILATTNVSPDISENPLSGMSNFSDGFMSCVIRGDVLT